MDIEVTSMFYFVFFVWLFLCIVCFNYENDFLLTDTAYMSLAILPMVSVLLRFTFWDFFHIDKMVPYFVP